jgi:DNA-binding IclR family transcriptional regulator
MTLMRPRSLPPAASGGVRPLSSALKTLAVLAIIGRAEGPLRLVEVAAQVKGSRATTYQKLITLVAAGWVEQTAEGTYRLSLRAARMGEAALRLRAARGESALRQAGLGERAAHVMEELVAEVGETACLAVINGVHAELVKCVEPDVVVRAHRTVGTLLSLNQSAAGRILTAFASDEDRTLLVKKGGALASEAVLREVRRVRYAVSTGQNLPGAQSVAIPVFDPNGACVLALAIVAPVSRFNVTRYIRPLARAAGRLVMS